MKPVTAALTLSITALGILAALQAAPGSPRAVDATPLRPMQVPAPAVAAARRAGTVRVFELPRTSARRLMDVQTDGSLLIAGYRQLNSMGAAAGEPVLMRYTPDGNIDASFSGNGVAPLGVPPVSARAAAAAHAQCGSLPDEPACAEAHPITALALLDDGRVLVVERSDVDPAQGSGGPHTATCFRADGSIDRSFGTDGRLALGSFSADSWLGIRPAPDGSFMVAVARRPGGRPATMTRYDAAGRRDARFTVDGGARSFAVRADGSVVVVDDSLVVRAVSPDGRPAPGFHPTDLASTTHGGIWSGDAIDIATGHDGEIALVDSGASPAGDGARVGIVARLRPDGSIDTRFADHGELLIDTPGFEDSANAVAIQPNGSIVIGGSRYREIPNDDQLDEGDEQFTLYRVTRVGRPDTSFSDDGRLSVHVSEQETTNSGDGTTLVRLAADGSVIALGYSDQTRTTAIRVDTHGAL